MDKITSENIIEAFGNWLKEQDKAPLTVRAYVTAIRDFAAWFERAGQEFTATAITPLDIRDYRTLLAKGNAPATVNRHLAALRAFARWANTTGRAEHDPTVNVKGMEQEDVAPRWLTRQEQFRLVRKAQEEIQQGDWRARGDTSAPGPIWARRDYALIVFLLHTGLRLSEVAALTLDDLNITPRGGEVNVRMGKGRKKREVTLNKSARDALSLWLAVRPSSTSRAVFLSQKGGAMTERAIGMQVTALSNRAGLKGVHPHSLRHSFAKNLIDEGVSLDKVACLMGHKNINTTRVYITPSKGDLQEATEKIAWED